MQGPDGTAGGIPLSEGNGVARHRTIRHLAGRVGDAAVVGLPGSAADGRRACWALLPTAGARRGARSRAWRRRAIGFSRLGSEADGGGDSEAHIFVSVGSGADDDEVAAEPVHPGVVGAVAADLDL